MDYSSTLAGYNLVLEVGWRKQSKEDQMAGGELRGSEESVEKLVWGHMFLWDKSKMQ